MYIVQRPPLENSDLLLFSEDRAEISSRAREILEFSALYIPLYTYSACMNNLYILVFVATYSRKIFFFSLRTRAGRRYRSKLEYPYTQLGGFISPRQPGFVGGINLLNSAKEEEKSRLCNFKQRLLSRDQFFSFARRACTLHPHCRPERSRARTMHSWAVQLLFGKAGSARHRPRGSNHLERRVQTPRASEQVSKRRPRDYREIAIARLR